MNTVNKSIFSKLLFCEILANDVLCLTWSIDGQFAQFSIFFFEMRDQVSKQVLNILGYQK